MKLNKNAIFSLFIVFLFIGSIVAAGILYYDPDRQNQPNNDIPEAPQTTYYANLDANVEEIFPNFIVVGAPNIYEETTIENDLREIDGITSVNVSFTSAEEEIIAIVNISYNKDQEEIYQKINESEIFNEISIFKNALLEIPKEIEFINNDTNETKDYFHPPGKVEAYVSYQTQKEDLIKASIFAVFQGNILLHIVGEEIQNLSASQEFIFDQKTYPVESWNNVIMVTAETNITNNLDINKLKEKFLEEEIEEYLSEHLEITTDQNITKIKEEINQIKEEKEYILNINLEENISIMFENNLTLEEYNLVLEELSKIVKDYEIIKEPKHVVMITFYKEDINLEEITTKIDKHHLEIKNTQKSANIKITNTTFNDKEYFYEQEITETFLEYPKDTNQTEILFDVSGIVQRNEILYLMLSKSEEIIEVEEVLEENINDSNYTE